ncbi:hypothetical protein CaCOL14_010158 [Colletotrichum acutatum]
MLVCSSEVASGQGKYKGKLTAHRRKSASVFTSVSATHSRRSFSHKLLLGFGARSCHQTLPVRPINRPWQSSIRFSLHDEVYYHGDVHCSSFVRSRVGCDLLLTVDSMLHEIEQGPRTRWQDLLPQLH